MKKFIKSLVLTLFMLYSPVFATSEYIKLLSPRDGAMLTVGKKTKIRFKYKGLSGSKAVNILVGMSENSFGSIKNIRLNSSSGEYEFDWIVSEMALIQYESPNNKFGNLVIKATSFASGPLESRIKGIRVKKGTGDPDSKMTCMNHYKKEYKVGDVLKLKWNLDNNELYTPSLSYEKNGKFGGYLVKKNESQGSMEWVVGEGVAGRPIPINENIRIKVGWGDKYCLSPDITIKDNSNYITPTSAKGKYIRIISPKRGTISKKGTPINIKWEQVGLDEISLSISHGMGTFGDGIAHSIKTNNNKYGEFIWTPKVDYKDVSLKITGSSTKLGDYASKYDNVKLYFSQNEFFTPKSNSCDKFGWKKNKSWGMCFWVDAGPGCNATPERGFYKTEKQCSGETSVKKDGIMRKLSSKRRSFKLLKRRAILRKKRKHSFLKKRTTIKNKKRSHSFLKRRFKDLSERKRSILFKKWN